MQITRIQTEIQTKNIDIQRESNRYKKDITDKKFELERKELIVK